MPDDRVVLILLEKLLRPRKSDLVDILVDLLGVRSPSSPLNSPVEESVLSFCVASTELEISSRRKISWSE